MKQQTITDIIQKECEILRGFDPEIAGSVQETLSRVARLLKHADGVLAFSHSDYLISLGGTEKVLHQEQHELAKRGISYLQIYGIPNDDSEYRELPEQRVGLNIDGVPAGTFTMIQLVLMLAILIENGRLCILAAHMHHLMCFHLPGVKFLLSVLHLERIRVFVHDYYSICPQFNLLKNGKDFCSGKCASGDCSFSKGKKIHFFRMNKFFKHLDFEVITPSEVAAGIWLNAYPEYANRVRIVPHMVHKKEPRLEKERLQRLAMPSYRIRIAFLGREDLSKGLESWWRLVSYPELSKQYDFFHLGAAGIQKPGVRYVDVSFLKDGNNAMVKALNEHKIDAVFLWSIWPETYSFTLYESFAANCFVITNPMSGNIAARLGTSSRGIIFENEKQLRVAMKDTRQIKSWIGRNLKENSPLQSEFNPMIAEETAKFKTPNAETNHGNMDLAVFEKFDTCRNPLSCMLVVETARAEQLKENKAVEIQKVLPISDIRMSPSYQVMDRFRQYCHKNKAVEMFARKLVNVLFRIMPK